MVKTRSSGSRSGVNVTLNPEVVSLSASMPTMGKGQMVCHICPNKTFLCAQSLCDHMTMVHGGVFMSLLSGFERVLITYVFNPSFYINFVWSIFSWACRNPCCSSSGACSMGSCAWILYTIALVYYPSIQIDGSLIGLSWAELSRSQNHIQNNQLSPQNYKVLYGSLPIVDLDHNWFQLPNCGYQALKDDSKNALCAESIDLEIDKIRKINNKRAKMLNGKWHQLSFTDEHAGSYVWGIPVPQSNSGFSFTATQLKGIKQILMPRWDLVAPNKDKLKELEDAFESSWTNMFTRWFFPWDIVKGYFSIITYQPWDQGNTVSVHNTHTMILFINDIWIPFCKWVVLNRYDFFLQIRYQHFKIYSIGSSWGAFIDDVFLIYRTKGKQVLTNEKIWTKMLKKFTRGKVMVKSEQMTYPRGAKGSETLCLLLGPASYVKHIRCLKGKVMRATKEDLSVAGIEKGKFETIFEFVKEHKDRMFSPGFELAEFVQAQQAEQDKSEQLKLNGSKQAEEEDDQPEDENDDTDKDE